MARSGAMMRVSLKLLLLLLLPHSALLNLLHKVTCVLWFTLLEALHLNSFAKVMFEGVCRQKWSDSVRHPTFLKERCFSRTFWQVMLWHILEGLLCWKIVNRCQHFASPAHYFLNTSKNRLLRKPSPMFLVYSSYACGPTTVHGANSSKMLHFNLIVYGLRTEIRIKSIFPSYYKQRFRWQPEN